jgi:sugar phosphate isomerase/epimerase
MKLGVFNRVFDGVPLEEMLDRLVEMGADAVELRSGPNSVKEVKAGCYPCQDHCDPAVLLEDGERLRRFQRDFTDRGLFISGLSAHGNPIHPNKQLARAFHESFERNVLLAEHLEVPVVILFSGCPGGAPEDTQPNWITYAWPPEHSTMLRCQWEEVVIPYWRQSGAFAEAHHVKLAIEPHPNFVVYNTSTLLRLRAAVGEVIGANLDPSHLL